MPLYALRQQMGESQGIEDAKRAAASSSAACEALQVRHSYWTGENRQLFMICEGQLTVPPAAGEAMAVIELDPADYLPDSPEVEARMAAAREFPLVLVTRRVGPVRQDGFRALAYRAVMCALEYDDMVWLRSYWAPRREEITCLFRTKSHALVREHAARSRMPCDAVYDAVELSLAC